MRGSVSHQQNRPVLGHGSVSAVTVFFRCSGNRESFGCCKEVQCSINKVSYAVLRSLPRRNRRNFALRALRPRVAAFYVNMSSRGCIPCFTGGTESCLATLTVCKASAAEVF